jgi:CBS domain-containing protein
MSTLREPSCTLRILAGDGSASVKRWRKAPRDHLELVVPVSEIMTRDVLCVRADVSVEALANLFLEQGIHGAPVVTEAGRLMGFVSMTDLIREQHDDGDTSAKAEAEPSLGGEADAITSAYSGFHLEEIPRATVADVMTQNVVTVWESLPARKAAALMAFEGAHRLPVVARDRKVVGMLSALDVLRWLARQEGYLIPDELRLHRRSSTGWKSPSPVEP